MKRKQQTCIVCSAWIPDTRHYSAKTCSDECAKINFRNNSNRATIKYRKKLQAINA